MHFYSGRRCIFSPALTGQTLTAAGGGAGWQSSLRRDWRADALAGGDCHAVCHGCCGGCDTRRVAVCAALPATHGRGAPKLGFAYLKCDKTGLSASRKAVSAVNIAINIQARLRSLLELSRIAFIIFHHNSIIFTPPPNSTLLYARSLV